MRPLRVICVATAIVMIAAGVHRSCGLGIRRRAVDGGRLGDRRRQRLAVHDDSELAGPFWSGWALATQNTFERLVVAAAPPLFAELIVASGYPLAFAIARFSRWRRCRWYGYVRAARRCSSLTA